MKINVLFSINVKIVGIGRKHISLRNLTSLNFMNDEIVQSYIYDTSFLKSYIAWFCEGRGSPRLYIGFKFFIPICTSQKHFKLIFDFLRSLILLY